MTKAFFYKTKVLCSMGSLMIPQFWGFFSVRDAVSQVYEFSAKILLPLLISFLLSASCLLGSQPPAERWRHFKDGQGNTFMNIICKLLWDGRHYINIRCYYY